MTQVPKGAAGVTIEQPGACLCCALTRAEAADLRKGIPLVRSIIDGVLGDAGDAELQARALRLGMPLLELLDDRLASLAGVGSAHSVHAMRARHGVQVDCTCTCDQQTSEIQQ